MKRPEPRRTHLSKRLYRPGLSRDDRAAGSSNVPSLRCMKAKAEESGTGERASVQSVTDFQKVGRRLVRN